MSEERGDRSLLAGRLLGTIPPLGCGCRACTGDPFEPEEVASVLDHLGDEQASMYATGRFRLYAHTQCENCDGQIVVFSNPFAPQRFYASGDCPTRGRG